MTLYHNACRYPVDVYYDKDLDYTRYSCKACNVQINDPSSELTFLQQTSTRHINCGAWMPRGYNVCPSCKVVVHISELEVRSVYVPMKGR